MPVTPVTRGTFWRERPSGCASPVASGVDKSQAVHVSQPFYTHFLLHMTTNSCSVDQSPFNAPIALDCGPLSPPINGEVNTPSTLLGSQATYSCLGSGYILRGDSSRQCSTSGEWTGTRPICDSESCLVGKSWERLFGPLCSCLLVHYPVRPLCL